MIGFASPLQYLVEYGCQVIMGVTVVIARNSVDSTPRAVLENAITERCAGAGLPVLLLPELYHLPEESPVWSRLAALRGTVAVLSWLYPRPMEWLLRHHRVGAEGLLVLTMRGMTSADEALSALAHFLPNPAAAEIQQVDASDDQRWYPVVDRSRCTQCRHCLQFCLFGVYGLDADDQVTVQTPDACKAGCPACSRICPQGAIIFPLYEKDAAIAGVPGLFMEPDAAARKMFYTRTKLPCPRCGATEAGTGGEICTECGRPTSAVPVAGADDLDNLIDSLDALTRRTR